MLRWAPLAAILILTGPIAFGLMATLGPAFGYFPALGGTQFSSTPFVELFGQPGIWRSVFISLSTGLITTAISVAFVACFFAAWSNTALFLRMQHLISPLLSIPHAAAAFGIAFLIAPSGWIMRLLSPEITGMMRPPDLQIINDPNGFAMMAGLIIKEIPFLFLVALAAMPQAKPGRFSKAAASLGYGRMASFFYAVWPNLYPQIRLAVFAVIAYSSSVVDVALILGPTNPAPLAVRLVTWMSDPDLTMRFQASAGALLQLGVSATALLLWIAGEKAFAFVLAQMTGTGKRFQGDRFARGLSAFFMFAVALSIFFGLVILAIWSVAGYWNFPDAFPRSFTLKTWMQQTGLIERPFLITLVIGLLSTGIAIMIALACLERESRTGKTGGSRALALLYLPLIIPQPAFVFGLQLFFLSFDLNATLFAMVLVHLVFVLPYVFLSLSESWRAWDTRYAQIASSMGTGQNRIFWNIRFPMMLRAILVACAVGFAVSVGQYLPTVLIGAGRWPTLTTEAVALASGGDRRVTGVYAFLQMALPFAGFAIAAMIPAFLYRERRDMRAAS